MAASVLYAVVVGISYGQWISYTDPAIPKPDMQMAAGVWSGTAFLLGGYNTLTRKSVMTFDGSHFDNQGNILPIDTWGYGDYYTQIGSKLYMIDPSGLSINVYNMALTSNQFSVFTTIGLDVNEQSCLTSDDDTLFVIGGYDYESGSTLDIVRILDIAQMLWSNGASMNTTRRQHSCMMDPSTKKLYAIGGKQDTSLNSVEFIDTLIMDKWENLEPRLSTPVSVARSILHDQYIYIIGGYYYDGTSHWLDTVYIIDPTQNSLTLSSDALNYGIFCTALCVFDSYIHAFGGNDDYGYSNKWMKLFHTTSPTTDTETPTAAPSLPPSSTPTLAPTLPPTLAPSLPPSSAPSLAPSISPSNAPSSSPTHSPFTIANSSSLHRKLYQHAVAYWNSNVTLLGGESTVLSVTHQMQQYDAVNHKIHDYGTYFIPNGYGVSGMDQYYTQISKYLYILVAVNSDSSSIYRYDLDTNTMETTAWINMETATNEYACITSDKVSNSLIIIGGYELSQYEAGMKVTLDTVQILDVSATLWMSNVPSLNQVRSLLTCNVHLPSKRVYAIGGLVHPTVDDINGGNTDLTYLNTIEYLDISDIYNMDQKSWQNNPYTLPFAAASGVRSVVYVHNIYVIGGISDDTTYVQQMQIIDTSSGIISFGAVFNPSTGLRASACVVIDGVIYAFGGRAGDPADEYVLDSWQYYDTCISTMDPSISPTNNPSTTPTKQPTLTPITSNPSVIPTKAPSVNPTNSPVHEPSDHPTKDPSGAPTRYPSVDPSKTPSRVPTKFPISDPNFSPSKNPTFSPSKNPIAAPTDDPTSTPTDHPVLAPTNYPASTPTDNPTSTPTDYPAVVPTNNPISSPTTTTYNPASAPTDNPIAAPTNNPVQTTTDNPAVAPTDNPTSAPADYPAVAPTDYPAVVPTNNPILSPTTTTNNPATAPTDNPTAASTNNHTLAPTNNPVTIATTTDNPALAPTDNPVLAATNNPVSAAPTDNPASTPTDNFTSAPTDNPVLVPTDQPASTPTDNPTSAPADYPAVVPTVSPTNCEHNEHLENEDCTDDGCEYGAFLDFTLSFSVCRKQPFVGNRYGLWNAVVDCLCDLGFKGTDYDYSNGAQLRRRLKRGNNNCDMNVVKYSMESLTEPISSVCNTNGYRFAFGIQGCGDCVYLTQSLYTIQQMTEDEIYDAIRTCAKWVAIQIDKIGFEEVEDVVLEGTITDDDDQCDLTANVERKAYNVFVVMSMAVMTYVICN